jgi:G:T-mismatch repair DNA endonuclease (very short patch repair protein)
VFTSDQVNLAVNSVNTRRRTGLANTIEYWINKGLTVDQAMAEALTVQRKRSAKSPASKKGARGYSVRATEYWIKQGFSMEQAIGKVREIQTTNGLQFYRNKYGDLGLELFNARIQKWLNAPGNKEMTANRSKKSMELFAQLNVGHYGNNEKTVRGALKVHRVDFVYGNKIIEYYGDYWHGNPCVYNKGAMIRKKKIEDVWAHDAKKVQDLTNNGYSVLIIWEKGYTTNPAETLQKCKDFINVN